MQTNKVHVIDYCDSITLVEPPLPLSPHYHNHTRKGNVKTLKTLNTFETITVYTTLLHILYTQTLIYLLYCVFLGHSHFLD